MLSSFESFWAKPEISFWCVLFSVLDKAAQRFSRPPAWRFSWPPRAPQKSPLVLYSVSGSYRARGGLLALPRSCEKKRVLHSAGMETATASHRPRLTIQFRFEQVRKPTSQAAKPRPAAKASPFSTSPRQAQRWAQAYRSQVARHAELVTTRHSLLRQAQLQPATGHD